MSRRKSPMAETSTSFFFDTLDDWLDQKIDEAEIDLADVQVQSVIQTMYKLVTARARALGAVAEAGVSMMCGEATMQEFDAITAKLDEGYAQQNHILLARLWSSGVDFDDEKVIEALTFAKEVLTYISEHESDDLIPIFNKNSG
jgi:hypothetical protein